MTRAPRDGQAIQHHLARCMCCAVLLPVVLSPRPAVTCHPQLATACFSRGTKLFFYWLDPSCCKINPFSTCIKGHNSLQFLPARHLHLHGNMKPTLCTPQGLVLPPLFYYLVVIILWFPGLELNIRVVTGVASGSSMTPTTAALPPTACDDARAKHRNVIVVHVVRDDA